MPCHSFYTRHSQTHITILNKNTQKGLEKLSTSHNRATFWLLSFQTLKTPVPVSLFKLIPGLTSALKTVTANPFSMYVYRNTSLSHGGHHHSVKLHYCAPAWLLLGPSSWCCCILLCTTELSCVHPKLWKKMVPTNPELTIFFFNSSTHVEKLSEILASEMTSPALLMCKQTNCIEEKKVWVGWVSLTLSRILVLQASLRGRRVSPGAPGAVGVVAWFCWWLPTACRLALAARYSSSLS